MEVKVAALTLALATATDSYLWIARDSTPHKRTTADGADMLLPPDTAQPYAYLGMLTKDGSDNTTVIDLSGVCYVRGGMLWRQTADAGVPGDTPPAGLMLWTRTAGGLYLWDGTAYTGAL